MFFALTLESNSSIKCDSSEVRKMLIIHISHLKMRVKMIMSITASQILFIGIVSECFALRQTK